MTRPTANDDDAVAMSNEVAYDVSYENSPLPPVLWAEMPCRKKKGERYPPLDHCGPPYGVVQGVPCELLDTMEWCVAPRTSE